MTYSNPAGQRGAAADAYVASLLALLGSRDPLEVLGSTPAVAARVLAHAAPSALTKPEAPGKWSVAGVLQHLADSEGINGQRIRLMLVEDTPPIAAYDQDAWGRVFGYEHADPGLALRDFTALRAANLRLWASLDATALARGGMHAERGLETAGTLIRLLAGHDLVHLKQIGRILGASAGKTSTTP
ncbi:MAG TPA: DinB family protein [Gemmatimonadales bacterium]|jgi:hypothetical protein|nr:DinB family protein [Gemmatimonadales bacterium]